MVIHQPGTEIDPLMYEDIMLADLGIVVDYFTSYGHESAQDLEIRGFSFWSKAKRVGSGSIVKDLELKICRSGRPERSI